ncbi:MAG: hypothetical protein ACRD1H_00665, partial [Vicinamibacterales bacterium]
MQSQDNASAARTCLILVAVFTILTLIVCIILAIGLAPIDLRDDDGPPPDQRGTVEVSVDEPGLRFTVLDVGQGACVVVISPNGRVLVADAGRSQERVREIVIPYLREQG